MVFEGKGDDYYSDNYDNFGDVEDVGVLTSDPEIRGEAYPLISSSSSSQKAPK